MSHAARKPKTAVELGVIWLNDATEHYRLAGDLLTKGNREEAEKHIALGEECFLHADQVTKAANDQAHA